VLSRLEKYTMTRRPETVRVRTLLLSGIAGINLLLSSGRTQSLSPVKPDPTSIRLGSALYAKHCATCHGVSGKGNGKAACDLDPRPADLTDGSVAKMSDGQLFRKISNGRKPMPSFRKLMTDEERWHVVNFIRTLAAHGHSGEKR
jgi:mono/diheme cytochrome c family protein